MEYTTLMPLLKDHQMQNEEIWEIISFNDALYFRSFGAIYKYNGEKIVPVQNVLSNAMIVFQDQLFLSLGSRGIFILTAGGKLIPLKGQEILEGRSVVDFADDGEQLILGTAKGLFTYSNGKLEAFSDQKLNEQLERDELNHILKISDEEFAFATVKNGIIFYNQPSQNFQIYNRNSGLQNNTVLSMALYKGKLWLGLDNGIDVIDLESPVKFYTDDSGELGAVYDLTFLNSNMYLASNTGVYELSQNDLALLNGAEGHSWNLEVIDDILYSNHNKGTFSVQNNKLIPVEERTGSFTIEQPPAKEKGLLIGNYTGISVYDPSSRAVHRLREVNFPVKKIVFENSDILWVAHPYEGLYRMGIQEDLKKTSFIEKVNNIGKKGGYKADVFRINNQIAVFQDNIWYKYNALLDTLLVFEELRKFENHRLLLEDRTGYWFTNTISNSIVFTDFKEQKLNLAFRELNERLVKGNENLIKYNDSIYYITLNDGFGEINLNKLIRAKRSEDVSKPIVYSIKDSKRSYNIEQLALIPFKNARDVQFRIALPDSDAMELRYELEGRNGHRGKVVEGNLNFQNLSYGDYRLKLYAVSAQGAASETTIHNFEVLPPWYLSNLMKAVYFLCVIGVIGLIFWYNRRKLLKHQRMLELKFRQEHEERLRKIEKERLVHEINSKRKELANTTMIGAKKNEVLMEIQGELNRDKDKFSNQFRLKHIMNKINHAIKSKDEWKLFETNFNELHEDFSKELLKKYPRLSNKDLKLCSYLKMNLSSKEIAPLMGISIRGVEVHRYRLRKKMNLDSKENLTNYLIKNF
ncbi:LuxR C-terminal-related transcriptional regulator [Antarcticibacterium sp. 1MA-6-2]|uniref:helix-turn-helix and ligand-binding sensor domain-containing protein n=1 Tax=Antarcticibacterium sp. 1MA-6-2 TaxID=2908210 RepID=UPI001F32DA6F|nr:LuxR C-terminal-related transcriptional regulator [Antarcticibacterium sp. 1MA-6-2]UJH92757.1 LuxR C-terminal-related transcriptional regulator [Antarcticibacterium sp. 1MA-6-2]